MKTKFSGRQCPASAEWVALMRERFGEDTKVIWLDENGVQHGRDEREKGNADESDA